MVDVKATFYGVSEEKDLPFSESEYKGCLLCGNKDAPWISGTKLGHDMKNLETEEQWFYSTPIRFYLCDDCKKQLDDSPDETTKYICELFMKLRSNGKLIYTDLTVDINCTPLTNKVCYIDKKIKS